MFSSFIFAYSGFGTIQLLAVSESGDGTMTGSVADLYLEIKQGNGRVFIDTYPFTKLDTQFTTRYAKNFACDYANVDCDNLDFFYTIKAGSNIIGGPSAGAATTLLTAAMLQDKKVSKTFSLTGTISSGGIIGPVGSVEEKIIAAAKIGIKKVYIPKISGLNDSEIVNLTLNEGIQIIPVSNFDELYSTIFQTEKKQNHLILIPSDNYIETMKSISKNLCDDAIIILDELEELNITNSTYKDLGLELYNKSINETVLSNHYSAASFCFGAASQFQIQKIITLNDSETSKVIRELSLDYLNFSSIIKDSEIEGFTDLQAYMITMQRLSETLNYLFSDLNISKNKNFSLYEKETLGFAIIRFKSAIYWSKFLGIEKNEEFTFDDSSLHNSCLSKLNEVEGYINYVKTYLSLPLVSTSKDIQKAYEDYYRGDYALCLFKSIKAKADAELILSSLNVGIDGTDELIVEKEKIARNTIANSIDKGIFPLIAYSYYTYGNSLKDSEKYSALLYYEYASAMSDISIYFEKKESTHNNFLLRFPREYYYVLSLGIIIGAAISTIVVTLPIIFSRKKNKKKIPAYKKNRKK